MQTPCCLDVITGISYRKSEWVKTKNDHQVQVPVDFQLSYLRKTVQIINQRFHDQQYLNNTHV